MDRSAFIGSRFTFGHILFDTLIGFYFLTFLNITNFINNTTALTLRVDVTADLLVFLLGVREIISSNPGPKIVYPDYEFFVVFLNQSRQLLQ